MLVQAQPPPFRCALKGFHPPQRSINRPAAMGTDISSLRDAPCPFNRPADHVLRDRRMRRFGIRSGVPVARSRRHPARASGFAEAVRASRDHSRWDRYQSERAYIRLRDIPGFEPLPPAHGGARFRYESAPPRLVSNFRHVRPAQRRRPKTRGSDLGCRTASDEFQSVALLPTAPAQATLGTEARRSSWQSGHEPPDAAEACHRRGRTMLLRLRKVCPIPTS
jgi:hypothetical protein